MASTNSKKKYEEYKQKHTREKNKARKIAKHLRRHPQDELAQKQLAHFQTIAK